MLRVVLLNIKLQHRLMHLSALREADCPPLQPFQVCAEVQVLAFNILCPLFADPMLRPRNQLLIGLPLIGAKTQHLTSAQLSEESATSLICALTHRPRDDLFGARLKGIP